MHRAHAVGPQRPRPLLALALTALVASTAAAAGCLGSKPVLAGTAEWGSEAEGVVDIGRELYHYRTVYWPEPDTLDPGRDGIEVVFHDVRFYVMLVTCAIPDATLSCVLRVSIFLLDLLYEDDLKAPGELPAGSGQVYMDKDGGAGFLWKGGDEIRLLVEA